jgi:Leucine-rich repeat (LRR) protein
VANSFMRRLLILLLLNVCVLFAADSSGWITALGGKVERDAKANIVAVNLRGSWVSDVELIDIARMPKLERLDLSHTRITDEGMLNLKSATGIRELNLFYAELITDQGMSAIRNWTTLRRLNVRGTRIANGTLEIVSHLPHLEALDIANTQVTDNGLDLLIALTALKELAIGRTRSGGEMDLSFLRMMPSLTALDLSGARPLPPDMGGAGRRPPPATPPIPGKTVEALSQLKNLRSLKLGFSGVSAADLKALSVIPDVEKLGLEECPRVDDAAIAELAHWKGLRYLDLQATHTSPAAVDTLRKAKPGIVILYSPAPPAPARNATPAPA